MKRSILLLVLVAALASCTGAPPVSGTLFTEQGEVTILPDGRIEVIVQPLAEK